MTGLLFAACWFLITAGCRRRYGLLPAIIYSVLATCCLLLGCRALDARAATALALCLIDQETDHRKGDAELREGSTGKL